MSFKSAVCSSYDSHTWGSVNGVGSDIADCRLWFKTSDGCTFVNWKARSIKLPETRDMDSRAVASLSSSHFAPLQQSTALKVVLFPANAPHLQWLLWVAALRGNVRAVLICPFYVHTCSLELFTFFSPASLTRQQKRYIPPGPDGDAHSSLWWSREDVYRRLRLCASTFCTDVWSHWSMWWI